MIRQLIILVFKIYDLIEDTSKSVQVNDIKGFHFNITSYCAVERETIKFVSDLF